MTANSMKSTATQGVGTALAFDRRRVVANEQLDLPQQAPCICEPLKSVAYLHDGTLEGLLSSVFLAYERKENPEDITTESRYAPRLEQSCIFVQTDYEKALRVRKGVERAAGTKAFRAIMRASTCDNACMGVVVLRFVRYAMSRSENERKRPIMQELTNPIVSDLLRFSRYASNEAERMRQFVRFAHLENGVWYARINPSANVLPLIMGYFADRLNDQPFIIYDETHKIAGVYDGVRWHLVKDEVIVSTPEIDRERTIREAWRRFYDTLSVEDRYHPELRRHFMPVRLWRNLPEMAPECTSALARDNRVSAQA